MCTSEMKKYTVMLKAANAGLLMTLIMVIATILICYPFAEHFSLTTQVLSHITMIVTAALLKLAYVTRCVAQHNLNLEVR